MLPSIMYIYSRRKLDSTSLLKEHIVARAPSKAQGETQGNQRKPKQSKRGNQRMKNVHLNRLQYLIVWFSYAASALV